MKRRVYIGGFKEFTRMPLPQTGIFIAHDFSGRSKEDDQRDAPRQVKDYRFAYEDGLRGAGYTPVYAPVHSGTILETLVKEMINTDAGIFDVSFGRKYNANVLIELGISLGLNHPTVVVAETADKPLLDFLEVLHPFYYGDDDDLADEIGKVVGERIEDFDKRLKPYYCVSCQQESCSCRKNLHTQERSYLLLGADGDQSEHKRLRRNMKQVAREFNMTPLDSSTDHNTSLCGWLYTIKRSKLVLLYSQELGNRHHGPQNALTMVQLGLCIAANVRWRFIIAENENPPTDIVNYIDIRLSGGIELDRENIGGAIGALNSETDPYQGTYDVLEPPEYVEEDELDIDIPEEPEIATTTFMVADLPEHYVQRDIPTLDSSIESISEYKSNILGLLGNAGSGKTTTALAICHDERIRSAYSDGIFWISAVTSVQDLLQQVSEFIAKLGAGVVDIATLNDARERLREAVDEKHILIVWDDIEDVNHARGFIDYHQGNISYIFTSRNHRVLEQLDMYILNLDELSIEDAFVLLTDNLMLTDNEIENNRQRIRDLFNLIELLPRNISQLSAQIRNELAHSTDLKSILTNLQLQFQTSSEYDIFISHASADTEFVDKLVKDLERVGIKVWADSDSSLTAGQDWKKQIDQAIKACKIGIVILSNASIESSWVQYEIMKLLENSKTIIPILIESQTKIPSILSDIQYADFTQDYASNFPKLIAAISQYVSLDISGDQNPEKSIDQLTQEQRSQLISILSPNFSSADERRAIIMQIFEGTKLVDEIDFTGSSTEFTIKLVNTLESFGLLETGENPLVKILLDFHSRVGIARQREIANLLDELGQTPKLVDPKIFINYSRADSAWVDKFVEDIRTKTNYSVWRDEKIALGANWWDTIIEKIQLCDVFFHISTPESYQSPYAIAELEYAVTLNKPIIPIMLRPSEYPDALNRLRIQYLQVRFEDAIDEVTANIIDAINQLNIDQYRYQQPASLPQPPVMPNPHTSSSKSRLDVFISSTSRDLSEYRKALRDNIIRLGMYPILMENMVASDTDALQASLNMVDQADIFILILAHRYGYMLDNDISLTELEYNRAVERGIPCFIFVVDDKAPWANEFMETDPRARTKLQAFKNRLHQNHVVGFFKSPEDLSLQVLNALNVNQSTQENKTSTPLQENNVLRNWEFIEIPSGEYTLGTSSERTTIALPRFKMSKHLITNALYAQFMESNGYNNQQWWNEIGWAEKVSNNWVAPQFWNNQQWNGEDKPVVGISWYEALAFCKWMSNQLGQNVQLPSENQWQSAAQGNDNRLYPWGNEWDCTRCNCSVSPCKSSETTPISKYLGISDSPFGLVDMSGNVWEWCITDYQNPGSSNTNTSNDRIVRGGSWSDSDARLYRCDYRSFQSPSIRSNQLGFRVLSS